MTGKELLQQLTKLSEKELELPVLHIHTEYASSEDSMGYEVEQDIDSVSVRNEKVRFTGEPKRYIQLGY